MTSDESGAAMNEHVVVAVRDISEGEQTILVAFEDRAAWMTVTSPEAVKVGDLVAFARGMWWLNGDQTGKETTDD